VQRIPGAAQANEARTQDAGFPFSQESRVQESFCSDRQKTVKHFSVFCNWCEVGVTLFARRSARELSHKSAAADIIRLAFVIRFPLEKDCRRKYPFLGEFSCPEIRNFHLGLGNPWPDDRWSPAKEKIHQSARGIKGSRCRDIFDEMLPKIADNLTRAIPYPLSK